MKKLKTGFFTEDEVLFVGYSSRNNVFSKGIYQAFLNNKIKVYPMNHKPGGNYDVKVYHSLEEIPAKPVQAFVLLNKENTRKVIKQLSDFGIKKILFQRMAYIDQPILDECGKLGMEASVGCPMMLYGSGLHKFHAFLSGVR
jgi:predicted CoA-binding protein